MRVLRKGYSNLPDDLWDADIGGQRSAHTVVYACNPETKQITREDLMPDDYNDRPSEWFDVIACDELHAFQILMAFERGEWEYL